jgi:hypothetical protein
LPSLALLGVGGSAGLSLADGYYYVFNAVAATIAGAVSGPNLHDGSDGDTATGYANVAGNASFFHFRVKAAGMTFDSLHASPGYTDVLSPTWWGSDDGVTFTQITTNNPLVASHSGFAYAAIQWTGTGTWKIIGQLVVDTRGIGTDPLQAGSADLRIRFGGSEVA